MHFYSFKVVINELSRIQSLILVMVVNFHSVKRKCLHIIQVELIVFQWRGGRGGRGARPPPVTILGQLKSKGGAKIRNYQCEISYKICKVQLVNKFKVVVILAFL